MTVIFTTGKIVVDEKLMRGVLDNDVLADDVLAVVLVVVVTVLDGVGE